MDNSSQRFNKNIPAICYASSRALLVVLGVLTGGCVAGTHFAGGPENVVTKQFPETEIRPPVYLTPGDVIAIEFLYWPELDIEQQIRPDGKISLELVGHIDVSGMTVSEMDEHLHEIYADKIKEPQITTVVRSFGNRRAYIAGARESS